MVFPWFSYGLAGPFIHSPHQTDSTLLRLEDEDRVATRGGVVHDGGRGHLEKNCPWDGTQQGLTSTPAGTDGKDDLLEESGSGTNFHRSSLW